MFHMEESEIEAIQEDRRREAEADHQLIRSVKS
jgi:hypothetical protein